MTPVVSRVHTPALFRLCHAATTQSETEACCIVKHTVCTKLTNRVLQINTEAFQDPLCHIMEQTFKR